MMGERAPPRPRAWDVGFSASIHRAKCVLPLPDARSLA
jgi:hypothetical protein